MSELRPNIIAVDDQPTNLHLLEAMLRLKGYGVRSFLRAAPALEAAAAVPPELILLDVNMPEMNGYEMCERLKTIPALADIPVIFLSALTRTEDKVKAFRAGAVDYISKPFQFEEVYSRVETHLKLHELRRTLASQNEHLEDIVSTRTRELAEANERLRLLDRSKNAFLNLISHEFRTPLIGLLGVAELILEGVPHTAEHDELCSLFERSRRNILSILDDALLLTRIDANGDAVRFGQVSLRVVLERAIQKTTSFAESRHVKIKIESQHESLVVGDEELLVRGFDALLETAVKFSPRGSAILLKCEDLAANRLVVIETWGRSVPDEAMSKFFDLFAIHEAIVPGGDLGLGPPVANRIFSLFGASVGLENLDPPGIRLTVSLSTSL